jgi:phosphoesterase RecJ-like protein
MSTDVNPPTDQDYRAAAAEVAGWRRPLLLTHERPDGDGLGSLLAMRAILRARDVSPVALVFEPIPQRYAFMPGASDLHLLSGPDDAALAQADGVLVMDTCSFSQLTPVAGFLRETAAPIVVVDHHLTRDLPAARYLLDSDAAAAALILYRWAVAAGWELALDVKSALFVGIATDTGWFRFSNTSPECLRAAADLIEQGVDLDGLHRSLYLSDPLRVLRARSIALASLELHQSERVAVMMVTRKALADAGAIPTDLEEVVNLPMSAAPVEVSMLLVERADGGTKCSLRSKGAVDVSQVAARFGGGGHARAAGARMDKTLSEARDALLAGIVFLPSDQRGCRASGDQER